MNKLTKRALSMLLALVLCLGLLPVVGAPAAAATVEYVTADGISLKNKNPNGTDQTVDVILNWGERGTTATFLSANAVSFYADNNVSYVTLSDLAGDQDQNAVNESELYAALQSLLTDTHGLWTDYDDTRYLYQYTDCQYSDINHLTCFYSGALIGPEWDAGKTWNREHTWPKSKSLDKDVASYHDKNDLMMLRPTSSAANSSRNNAAYGESDGYFDPNGKATFTDVRGDVARIMLYQYIRWELPNSKMWGTDGVIESAEVLLDWMEADPVDTWEMGRNDSVESITGTRNVFVDYPELAFALFEAEIPADMPTPSTGVAADEVIKAVANNADFGSVYVSNNAITAIPGVGYQVAGYKVLEGNAHVTQNKNIFLVDTDADCKIQINFEARAVATVLYNQNGTIAASANAYVGDSIQLAGHTGAAPEGYSFLGWVSAPVDATDTEPAAIVKAGEAYTPAASTTLYALYSWMDNSQSSGATYTKYTGALTEGDYLITYDNGAMKAVISSSRFGYADITVANDSISNLDASLIWTLTKNGSYWNIYNEGAGKYAASTGVKNKGQLLASGADDKSLWTVEGTTTYEFINKQNEANKVNMHLRRNGTYGFACYAESTGGALTLYKLNANAGTTMFGTATATGGGAVTAPEATLNGGTAISLQQAVDYATSGSVIKLEKDVTAEITLPDNVTLDLAGYTFTGGIIGGIITDSTDGGGRIISDNAPADATIGAVENAPQMLLKDGNDWRIFTYDLRTADTDTELSNRGDSILFWFDLSFTNAEAYDLVATGKSDLTVNATFSWNEGSALEATFGSNLTVADWAAKKKANANYQFYVLVKGLSTDLEGTLYVTPEVSGHGDLGVGTIPMSYTFGTK